MRILRFDFNDGADVSYGVANNFAHPVLVDGWFRFETSRSDEIGVSEEQVRCWLVYDEEPAK